MRMRSLYVFVKLAESNCDFNVHKALGIPRSSMWSYITDLEKTLKKQLINRKKQSLTFTAAGEEFIPHAYKIYQAYEESLNITEAGGEEDVAGDILISMTAAMAFHCSMESMRSLFANFPYLHLYVTASDTITKDEENASDVLIRPFGESENFIKFWHTQYQHGLFASEDYIKHRGMPKCPEDLIDHRLIGYGEHKFSYFDDINWHLKGVGYGLPKLKPVLTINSTRAIFDAASNGLGICSAPIEASNIYKNELTRILPEIIGPTVKTYFCIKKSVTGRRLRNIHLFRNYFEDHLKMHGLTIYKEEAV